VGAAGFLGIDPASARRGGDRAAKLCTPVEVSALVRSFIAAYNRGDGAVLDTLFAREPDFGWFSTTAPVARFGEAAKNRATLVRYFAQRHARAERLQLRSVQVNGNTVGVGIAPYGNFEYRLIRRANDLPPTRYHGKGAARCFSGTPDLIFIWSMSHG
jgi:ketosteroid isomerase-like protein